VTPATTRSLLAMTQTGRSKPYRKNPELEAEAHLEGSGAELVKATIDPSQDHHHRHGTHPFRGRCQLRSANALQARAGVCFLQSTPLGGSAPLCQSIGTVPSDDGLSGTW
jgi:hypothetical protein